MTGSLVSYAPSSLAELEDWAKRYASAGMFGRQWQNKPMDAVIAIMWGAELGLQTISSLNSIAVINGKPSLYGDALVGLARRSGKVQRIEEGFTGKPYEDTFTAWCTVTRVGGDVSHHEFSVADAKRAKLWGKAGPWSDYPRRMLQIRPRTFALRDAVSELGLGPSAEEMQDAAESEETRSAKARDVTPPRQHEDGTPYTPIQEVDAANAEAAEPERVAKAEQALSKDPLGINGSSRETAFKRLAEGITSAMTAADITALYRVYGPRIAALPDLRRRGT